jgi:hypothetical protein
MTVVGQPIPRVDGRLKVTGGARYTADIPVDGVAYGVFVYSELVHAAAVRANMRSILVAMMKSFSCSPLIFLVCSETVALPQPKLIFG